VHVLSTTRPNDFDPVSLEIYWSRLISITDESAAALVRTAFSTIVRESNDYATVLMDANGDSLAENTAGIPSFVGILPRTLRHMFERIPKESWRPGDCIITNDPWMATGHLLDVTMASPIFHKGKLVAFSGSTAHLPDIGGSLWSADCREVYEEGLRIPPVKFLREGKPNEDVFDFILGNVRVAEQVRGDLFAQVSAQQVCARRLSEFLDDTGIADLAPLSGALQTRADRAMRQAIAALPDGEYRSTVLADGFDEHETRIECRMMIDGDRMHIDYTGTSPQIPRGINCVMNYTHAYTVYPVKCAIDPLTPRNEGSYRSMTVAAPEGSILNPRYPAAVHARQLTGHLLAGAVYGCLAQAAPEKVIAECGGAPTTRALFSGTDKAGHRFSQIIFASGGMGAGAANDGLGATAFPTNVGAGSIEAFESAAPLIVWKKELRQDSGGAGRRRGGLGQDVVIEVASDEPIRLSVLADRVRHPAPGILGGQPGAPVDVVLADGTRPHPKSRSALKPGDKLTIRYAGGGGYGDPRQREPATIADDVKNGYVSAEAARRLYGWTG